MAEKKETKKEELESVFTILNKVNVNENTEKKNGLTYLSWTWALTEIKKRFPEADYMTLKDKENGNVSYFHSGKGAELRIIAWLTEEERNFYLSLTEEERELVAHVYPIMNYSNSAIKYEDITSTDVNKAIQRGSTKEWAYKGLGLYIYAGEDLPESEKVAEEEKQEENKPILATPKQVEIIKSNISEELLKGMLTRLNKEKVEDLTIKEASELVIFINKQREKEGA